MEKKKRSNGAKRSFGKTLLSWEGFANLIVMDADVGLPPRRNVWQSISERFIQAGIAERIWRIAAGQASRVSFRLFACAVFMTSGGRSDQKCIAHPRANVKKTAPMAVFPRKEQARHSAIEDLGSIGCCPT
jgi:transketolase C-terminal domain/subunit